MAKTFDLRKQFKLHDNLLLRRLFENRHPALSIPWESLKPSETKPITDAWESLGEKRRAIQLVLQEVNELSDSRGQRLLLEELQAVCPERIEEFRQLASPLDKALWAYLEAHDAFEHAAVFARAESLRGGQFSNRWNSMPKRPLEISVDKIAAFREAVHEFYWSKELRGEVCEIHHHRRIGDTDFFFAYLPDWPDKLLAFDTEGQLTPKEENLAFNNVFVFDPINGSVELIAKGGVKVQQQLRKAFCKTMLGIDVGDDEPLRNAYLLDQLIDSSFQFDVEPADRIAAVRIQRLRIVPCVYVEGLEYSELKFKAGATREQVLCAVDRFLDAFELHRSTVQVTQAKLQIEFLPEGMKAGKRMSFHVHLPNTCNLKSMDDEQRVVGERCLKRWGVLL